MNISTEKFAANVSQLSRNWTNASSRRLILMKGDHSFAKCVAKRRTAVGELKKHEKISHTPLESSVGRAVDCSWIMSDIHLFQCLQFHLIVIFNV